MDDGSGLNSGVKLSTQGFTKDECLFLIDLLKKEFNIKSTLHNVGKSKDKSRDLYSIYIWKESMPIFYDLISPYLIDEMQYKLNAWKISL